MAHSYDVGTKAWQPDVTEGWVASEVVSKTAKGDKVVLVFSLDNGEVCLPKLQHFHFWQPCSSLMLTCDALPDQDHRNDPRGTRGRQQLQPPSSNEPYDARSQR